MNYAAPTRELPRALVITRSEIARVLRCIPSHITAIEDRNSHVVVTLKRDAAARLGSTCTITLDRLETEFHRYRMESGADLEAYHAGDGHFGDRWDVRGSNGDLYQVEIVGDHFRCNCEDWHQHQTRCKHGWAVHFTIEATQKLSCHDCGHWQHNRSYCKLRAQADLEQLPITHAETCEFLIVGFEEF